MSLSRSTAFLRLAAGLIRSCGSRNLMGVPSRALGCNSRKLQVTSLLRFLRFSYFPM